jgi:hypothetical protein
MRFFTPDLLIRINSADRIEALHAHDEWECALENYRKHLKKIGRRLTPNARTIAKSVSLHDAQYLGLGKPRIPRLDHPIAVLATRKDGQDWLLVYTLVSDPKIYDVKRRWPFSKKNAHWLYDEFDVDQHGNQHHDALLSNGKSIVLIFRDVQLIKDQIGAGLEVA